MVSQIGIFPSQEVLKPIAFGNTTPVRNLFEPRFNWACHACPLLLVNPIPLLAISNTVKVLYLSAL